MAEDGDGVTRSAAISLPLADDAAFVRQAASDPVRFGTVYRLYADDLYRRLPARLRRRDGRRRDPVAETFRAAQAYVTGEITMYTRMYAKERKINLVAGTHYATETFGARALAQLVEARFGIAWTFVPESPDVY